MFVSAKMTKNPITVTPSTTILEARKIMTQEKIHRLPVVDSGKLVGIITQKDILSATPSSASTLDMYELTYMLAKLKVKKVMQKEVITTTPNTPIEEAAIVMVDNNMSGLPVVEKGYVTGIITESDIFKTFIDMFSSRDAGIRVTILVPEKAGELHDITQAIVDAKGDLVTLLTFPGTQKDNRICLLKVRDLTQAQLEAILKPMVMEIRSIHEVAG